jgi:GINS complex subunit 3
VGSSPLVSLDFPTALSQRVINALKADPKTVDLRAQAPHFYALGARILELFEEEEIVDVLLEVYGLVAV